MRTLMQDVRYAVRQLLKSPGFTLTAVLSLMCGIAATTAVFSVVWAVVMNPYPYAAPDRMVHFGLLGRRAGDDDSFGINGSQWAEIRKVPAIEDAVLTDGWRLTVSGGDLPEDVTALSMSSNGFQFFGVPAAFGRGLQPSDALDGQDPEPVVVLSYKFWQRRFGGDPGIVGKTIQMVRKPYTVVGVAAPRFAWGDADVYLPLKVTADPIRAYQLEARLRPGVTRAVAEQQMQGMFTRFEKETPKHFPDKPGRLHLEGLNDMFLRQIGGILALLFGSVLLLLAIGCGNVSILLLARGTEREHEFAVRAAIGASRWRIVRQLLTESLLLSVTGAVLGTLVAYRLLAVIVALLPQYSFPHEAAIAINLPVLIFSVVVSLLTGVLFGLAPALRLSKPDVREAMQAGTRRQTGSLSSRTTSNALIAGQIALTLLMMAAAGASIRGFMKLMHTNLGYDPRNAMSILIPLHENTYSTIEARSAYFEALRNKVAETPGVRMAAVSENATPPENGFDMDVDLLGSPSVGEQKTKVNLVSQGFFPLLRIVLDRGRLWTESENHNAARVALINEAMERRFFPQGGALGHSVRIKNWRAQPPYQVLAPGANDWLQIVGVTADKLDDGIGKAVVPEMFVPYTLAEGMGAQLLVKTSRPPAELLHTIALQVKSVDGEQQIGGNARDLEHWISELPEFSQQRIVAWLFGAFAGLALGLAGVGLYSVVSYTVARRTNEFGIRMALGATREHVLQLVFASTAVSVGSGIAAGVGLTLALRGLLARWAPGSTNDLVAIAVAAAIMVVCAVVASGIPARKATRIEPMEALRYE